MKKLKLIWKITKAFWKIYKNEWIRLQGDENIDTLFYTNNTVLVSVGKRICISSLNMQLNQEYLFK
ncbi:hypothetical protein EG14_03910 [Porphyromonas gingivalis]|nr:hypothetical protein EG14_03910 [Porphyromonas gingivalis]